MKHKNCLPLNGFVLIDKEITLAGTVEEISLFAREIRHRTTTHFFELTVPDDSPTPYDGFVAGIQLITSAGPVQIAFASSNLIISGSVEGRRMLSTLLLKAVGELGDDSSFIKGRLKISSCAEYPFLASTSLPLVVNMIGLDFEDSRSDLRNPQIFVDTVYRSDQSHNPIQCEQRGRV